MRSQWRRRLVQLIERRHLTTAETSVRRHRPSCLTILSSQQFSTSSSSLKNQEENSESCPSTVSDEIGSPTRSSYTDIYRPSSVKLKDPELLNCVRSCIPGDDGERQDPNLYSKDTGLSVCFLGTGAGVPGRNRNTSSTLVRVGGSSFLFDAGEGLQRQMAFTRAKVSHIEKIFITHLHGDHIYGLPGFLLGLQYSILLMDASQRNKHQKNHVVQLYGPPGLFNFVASAITLSCTRLHALTVEIYELTGARMRRIHHGGSRRDPFTIHYPEYVDRNLQRKSIPCKDGVWTISDFDMVDRGKILSENKRMLFAKTNKRNFRIRAAEVNHVPGVVTFGYTIEEDDPPRNIDANKAKDLGVSPNGKKYSLLKSGFSVMTDDGSREVQPSEVLLPRTKRARKISIVGDNRAWSKQMEDIAKDSDLLVHEATLSAGDENAAMQRGHSTSTMAGKVAGKVGAKVLALNHISSRGDRNGSDHLSELVKDAQQAAGASTKVLLTNDFMELLVPWLGFGGPMQDEGDRSDNTSSSNGSEKENVRGVVKEWFG